MPLAVGETFGNLYLSADTYRQDAGPLDQPWNSSLGDVKLISQPGQYFTRSMAASSARYPIFRECIERHFRTWSSLQLALREVMPGPLSAEFFTWLMDSSENFFYQNADLYPDEVGDFLSEILNSEMDTIIEDGSLELVCGALCQAFRACVAGRYDDVTAELAKLPAAADLSACRQAPATSEDDDSPAPTGGRQPTPPAISGEPTAPTAHLAPPPERMQTDDGWTVATRRKR